MSDAKLEVDHMGKPNLHLARYKDWDMIVDSPDHAMWEKYITALASFPATYVKVSGLFSEMEPLPKCASEKEEIKVVQSAIDSAYTWLYKIEQNFGAHRIMFGSDWPVCNVGGIGKETWLRWLKFMQEWVSQYTSMDEDDLTEEVFGGVAARVYGCKTSSESYRCDRSRCPFTE